MIDYDVVIIGGTATGIYAAITAASMQARVALVQPPIETENNSLDTGFRYSKVMANLGKKAREINRAQELGIYTERGDLFSQKFSVNFEEAMEYAGGIVSNQKAKHEPAVLASLGIDVVFGSGSFVDKPHLAFVVKGRHLRSRAYLLATPAKPIIPDIPGLSQLNFLTAENLGKLVKKKLPENLVIIGGDPIGTELAFAFSRLGTRVTMVVKSSRILRKEDPEAVFLVQKQLEAEGVRILTDVEVTQAKEIDGKKWLQVGREAIESDELLLAAGFKAYFEPLKLKSVGVKVRKGRLLLNKKLQTSNSHIYACGNLAGGYPFAHIGNYEAKVALKNILYLRSFKVDYSGISWSIGSDPELARVGMTEAQARHRFGDDVLVCRQDFKVADKAQILGETTGFFKLVAVKNGKILGASVVGPQASELVNIISLAICQGLKVEAIADLPQIWPTLGEMNGETATAWLRQRREANPWLRDLIENLFHWRRSWIN